MQEKPSNRTFWIPADVKILGESEIHGFKVIRYKGNLSPNRPGMPFMWKLIFTLNFISILLSMYGMYRTFMKCG